MASDGLAATGSAGASAREGTGRGRGNRGGNLAGMSRVGLQVRRIAALMLLCAVGACTPLFENHGYAPEDRDLDTVVVGQTTRDQLPDLIGRPSSSGVLNASGWYYVQSRWRTFAFKAPVEIDRQVIAISFADSGTVSNVERFGLQDGKVVALSRRITESNIKGISLIRQLLSNVGRISADQVVN